jgi:2-polyprenyl-6-methoxyphenol hydroxylase-like FAD-dependent oxidoreductase
MNAEVCIAGGGPAGLILALMLGRQGRAVVVMESTRSYKRSFRGESMQPDAIDLLDELGLTDALRRHGWMETQSLLVTELGRERLRIELGRKPYRYKFTIDVPQTVLLETISAELAQLENVKVLRGARVVGLIEEQGIVHGVQYSMAGAQHEVRSLVTVGADGRYSRVREMAGLAATKTPLDRDVLWCKFPRPPAWPRNCMRVLLNGPNHLIVLPTYPDLVRCGVNIPKNGFGALRREGIGALHAAVSAIDAAFGEHFRRNIHDWSDLTLLDIFTSTLARWGRPGLVMIGDAAHTVTPLLGQGVNLAIEDAYVLAAMLNPVLAERRHHDLEFVVSFQAARQPQVELVLRLQTLQERLLSARTFGALSLRRLYYMLMNNLPLLQSHVSDAIIYRRQKELAHYA